jgi:hypothetical protein
MSSTLLLDYIYAFILFLINILIIFFELFCRLFHHLQTRASSVSTLTKLQATRSVLLQQQADLSRRVADIDAAIASIQRSSNPIQQELTQQSSAVANLYTTPSSVQHSTPPRHRRRTVQRPSSIGKPYPLPYNPPRTPEEERRNNIVAWINDLRLQHIHTNGSSQ